MCILSRELSCALVEGGDLTVRDGVLYLKTLRGLQRVDVLLRRQDGRMMDPLELEAAAWRMASPACWMRRAAGAVKIVNDPGTGFAEAPGLAAFLPALAPRLLGEDVAAAGGADPLAGRSGGAGAGGGGPRPWLVRRAVDGTVPSLRPGGAGAGGAGGAGAAHRRRRRRTTRCPRCSPPPSRPASGRRGWSRGR